MLVPQFYYYRPWKSWVLTWHDAYEDQVGDCEYFSNKKEMLREIERFNEKQKISLENAQNP